MKPGNEMGNERQPERVMNRGDIKADAGKLRANCVLVISARKFLCRNLREKALKLALPPSFAQAVLHEFLRKV